MKINQILFNNLNLDQCLNYEVQYELESTITYVTSRIINEMRKRFADLSSDEAKEYYLIQCLLRLSINKRWLQISKQKNLTEENYLYPSLKRAYLFYISK